MPVSVKRVYLHPGMGLCVCVLAEVCIFPPWVCVCVLVLCVWLQVCKGICWGGMLHPQMVQGCVCALAGVQFCPRGVHEWVLVGSGCTQGW